MLCNTAGFTLWNGPSWVAARPVSADNTAFFIKCNLNSQPWAMAAAACSAAVAAPCRGCGAHANVSPTALTPAALAHRPVCPLASARPHNGRVTWPPSAFAAWPMVARGLCASRLAHVRGCRQGVGLSSYIRFGLNNVAVFKYCFSSSYSEIISTKTLVLCIIGQIMQTNVK